jgi:hypothetical protein
MANKRMFTVQIIDSDPFLDMPLSTQALYFHLNMRADDDGFINNPKKIQRMIGASDDDLKILIGKRFVLAFQSGVIVIKHWRMHNTLKGDRYTPTQYQDEKNMLQVKPNKAYTESDGAIPMEIGTIVETEWNQSGTTVKNSIDKSSKESKPTRHKYGEYGHILLTDDQYNKLKTDYPNIDATIKSMDEWIQLKGKPYKDYNLALRKWAGKDQPKKPTDILNFREDE